MDMSDLPTPAPQACRSLPVSGLRGGRPLQAQECVAEERPVAFEFNGIAHAVMMATPDDLEDFAYGFTLSEGIVDSATDIRDVEVSSSEQGYTLHVSIASACFARLKDLRRSLTGKTGCGLCGTESLAHAVRRPTRLTERPCFAAAAVAQAMDTMRSRQLLLSLTGATHAAAWCTAEGSIALLREDVGRHNALDKLVGALVRSKLQASSGFIAVTSRASYEMVQKTATAGVATLAAVSGVTALAVDVADEAGLTLLGFARGQDVCVYTHAEQFNESTR
jgi:formate dehydrogenase accessory protein FdhD